MEPWQIFKPEFADLHHFDEDPDPESHQNERAGPDADPQDCHRVSFEHTYSEQ